ncbi:MAG: IS110 family transposase [Chloroflexi bacterium]|nr:IS110 family transposase [Chloroflexota bacterium]
MTWIRAQRFVIAELDRALAEHLTALELRLGQRDHLEAEILAIAQRPRYAADVARLSCLRGIKALTALTLLVEVGDFARFPAASSFMAFTGLVPSEHSSGEARHQGRITKSGNAHLRRVLVEAAWAYRARPGRSAQRLRRFQDQPPELVARALASEQRLHARYWRIVQRGKRTTVAAVAVARELAGVVWGVMQPGLPA